MKWVDGHMIMRKETAKAVYTVEFSDYYSDVETKRERKGKGVVYVRKEPLQKYANSPTGFKNQLLLKGYKVI